MLLTKISVISTILHLTMAYPSPPSKRISTRIDESKEQSDDYFEKMADIFNLPQQIDGQENLENCENIRCMPHYLCINDMVVTNGTELFEWRIAVRLAAEKRPDKIVCGLMEMPCCADEAIRNLHQATAEGEDEDDKEIDEEEKDQSKTPKEYVDEDEKVNHNTPLNVQKCGYHKQQSTTIRIIAGNEAQANEFPWVIAIFLRLSNGNLQYIGGGSLIHESIILTVGHKLQSLTPEQLVIRAGEHNLMDTTENSKRQERNANNIILHENLDAHSLINDIALILLEKPLKLTEAVNTICLPPQSIETHKNTMCTASGWGKNAADRHGKYRAMLKKVELPIVGRRKCEYRLRKTRELGAFYNLDESLICAGGGRRDTCKGDGGAPLFCEIPNDKGHFYQSRIVTGGIGCGRQSVPGFYVNVAHFSDWILQQMSFVNLFLETQNLPQYELYGDGRS